MPLLWEGQRKPEGLAKTVKAYWSLLLFTRLPEVFHVKQVANQRAPYEATPEKASRS
jgi:hypothetical protein